MPRQVMRKRRTKALPTTIVVISVFLVLPRSTRRAYALDRDTSTTTRPMAVSGWSPQSICAALAWREGKLSESTFRISENRFLAGPGASGETLLRSDELEVKCKRGLMWIDLSERGYGKDTTNIDHAIQTWNGSQCRWISKIKIGASGSKLEGGITGEAPPLFLTTVGLDVLGFKEARNYYPWSIWISKLLNAKGASATVTERHERGHDIVNLDIFRTDQIREYHFEFLADKDFLCDDLNIIFDNDPSRWRQRTHVVGMKQFDGLWVPSKATQTIGEENSGNVIKFVLDSLSLAPPTDGQMKIDFPVGTRVVDSINLLNYVVKDGGQREYQPLYDANTGKVIQPPAQTSAPGEGGL